MDLTRQQNQAETIQSTDKGLTHNDIITQFSSYLDPRLRHSKALSTLLSSDPSDSTLPTVEEAETTTTEPISPGPPNTSIRARSRLFSLVDKAKLVLRKRPYRRLDPILKVSGSSVYKRRSWFDSLRRVLKPAPRGNSSTITLPPVDGSLNPPLRPPSPLLRADNRQPRGILVGSPSRTHSRRRYSHSLPRKVRFSDEVRSITLEPQSLENSPTLPSLEPPSRPKTRHRITGLSTSDSRTTQGSGVGPSFTDVSPGLARATTSSRPEARPARNRYNPSYEELPPFAEHNGGDIPAPLSPSSSTPTSLPDSSRDSQELQNKVAHEMYKLEQRIDRARRGWSSDRRTELTGQHIDDQSDCQGATQDTGTATLQAQSQRGRGMHGVETSNAMKQHDEQVGGTSAPVIESVGDDNEGSSDLVDSATRGGRDYLYHSFGFSDNTYIADTPPQSDRLSSPLTPIPEEGSSVGDPDNASEYNVGAEEAQSEDENDDENDDEKHDESDASVSSSDSIIEPGHAGVAGQPRTTTSAITIEEATRISTPNLASWAETCYEATTETARMVAATKPTSRHMQVDISAAEPSARPLRLSDAATTHTITTTAAPVTPSKKGPSVVSFEAPRKRERRHITEVENVDIGGAPQIPPLEFPETSYLDLMGWSVLAASTPRRAPSSSRSSQPWGGGDFTTPPRAAREQPPEFPPQTATVAEFRMPTRSRSRGPVRSAAALAALVEEELARHQAERQAQPTATMRYADVEALVRARRQASVGGVFVLDTEEDVRRFVRSEMLCSGPLFESAPATPERLRRRALVAATAALETQHGPGGGSGAGGDGGVYGGGAAVAATDARPLR